MNATVRAQNLMDLMRDLKSVLERENEILEHPRMHDLSPIVAEKQALFRMYDEQIISLAKDREFSATLTPEAREELRAASADFEAAARKNEKRLSLMVDAGRQIVSRITDAARSAAGYVDSYGSNGVSRAAPKAAPVALNRSL